MSAFYHEVLSYCDKHRKPAMRLKPKAIKALAIKTIELADMGNQSPKERAKIMAENAEWLLLTSQLMKNSVVFSLDLSGVIFVDDLIQGPDIEVNERDSVKLPYENCVFVCELPREIWDGIPEALREVMIVASQSNVPDGVTRYSAFARRNNKQNGWCALPHIIEIKDDDLQNPVDGHVTLNIFNQVKPSQDEHVVLNAALKGLLYALDELETRPHTLQQAKPPSKSLGPAGVGHRRFYQHRVIVIDPDAPLYADGEGLGCSGRKHALHSVRGFWRNLKNPKPDGTTRVWVKAHWRGDKDLGVISKEYEIRSTA